MSVNQRFYTREINAADYSSWFALFLAYREFYHVPQNAAEIAQTWEWLLSANENINALVCVEKQPDGSEKLVGLMHYFTEISSIAGKKGGFLNDLYVSPACRGQGVFEALFEALKQTGKSNGWSRIQWRTAEDNYRARSAYDRLSVKVPFLTYRMDIE